MVVSLLGVASQALLAAAALIALTTLLLPAARKFTACIVAVLVVLSAYQTTLATAVVRRVDLSSPHFDPRRQSVACELRQHSARIRLDTYSI
jgi:hypothetical protein